jgi:hypothetical protein
MYVFVLWQEASKQMAATNIAIRINIFFYRTAKVDSLLHKPLLAEKKIPGVNTSGK